jgi:hypothetical protein
MLRSMTKSQGRTGWAITHLGASFCYGWFRLIFFQFHKFTVPGASDEPDVDPPTRPQAGDRPSRRASSSPDRQDGSILAGLLKLPACRAARLYSRNRRYWPELPARLLRRRAAVGGLRQGRRRETTCPLECSRRFGACSPRCKAAGTRRFSGSIRLAVRRPFSNCKTPA